MRETSIDIAIVSQRPRRLLDVIIGVAIGLGAVGFVTLVDLFTSQQADGGARSVFLWALIGMGVLGFAFGVSTGYLARRATVSITAAVAILLVVIASPLSPFGSAGLGGLVGWVRGDFRALVLLSGLMVGLPAARTASAKVVEPSVDR